MLQRAIFRDSTRRCPSAAPSLLERIKFGTAGEKLGGLPAHEAMKFTDRLIGAPCSRGGLATTARVLGNIRAFDRDAFPTLQQTAGDSELADRLLNEPKVPRSFIASDLGSELDEVLLQVRVVAIKPFVNTADHQWLYRYIQIMYSISEGVVRALRKLANIT